ncbi:2-succinylbenzoate--CoA ligase-like [Musca autumnalis]|uniref:2-succinylbenzoate--CoA ligase-like n=1 Tax=Musca autumnalis TaxID=221902 RepID=UPI003CEE3B0E
MRSTDPNKIIDHFYDKHVKKTAKEVYEQSILIAINLQQMGIKKGDPVIFYSQNNEWIAVLLGGCILCGAVPLFFECHLDEESTAIVFDVVQPVAIFYEDKYRNKIEECLKRRKHQQKPPHLISIDSEENQPNVKSDMLKQPEQPIDFASYKSVKIDDTKDEIALLALTSGSTGPPKVVQLSHAHVMHGATIWWDNAENWEHLNENSVVFTFSPLRWITQIQLMLQAVLFGVRRVSSSIALGKHGLELMRNSGLTHIFASPTFYYDILLLLDENDTESFSTLRNIMLGGETPSKVVYELSKKHAVNAKHYYGYGMTEMASVICCDMKINGGKLLPGYELQILDDQWQPLGVNQPGQIALRPPLPLKGYKSMDNSVYYNDRGLFVNGDYGFMDEEGKLHVLARYKDVIKSHGEVIVPNTLEAILPDSIPEIYIARLVGYHKTPNDPNQIGAWFVVLHPNVTLSQAEISKKVMDTLKFHLTPAQFAIIQDVHIIDAMPVTYCGKLDRLALRKLAATKSYNVFIS